MAIEARECRTCGSLIPTTARRDQVYCGGACRQAAHRERHPRPRRDSWRAAAWMLERLAPERYGPARVLVDDDYGVDVNDLGV